MFLLSLRFIISSNSSYHEGLLGEMNYRTFIGQVWGCCKRDSVPKRTRKWTHALALLCVPERPQAKCLLNKPRTLLSCFLGTHVPKHFVLVLSHVGGCAWELLLAFDKRDLHASYRIIYQAYEYLQFHLQIISPKEIRGFSLL